MRLITPLEFLAHCKETIIPLLDVRAPIEFQKGSMPLSVNEAILDDNERAAVGTCYKEKGQKEAINLGQQLVAENKKQKIVSWQKFLSIQKMPVLTCWRGGLRSRTAQEWLSDRGTDCYRLQGGYKALRKHLIQLFDLPYQGYLLTGLTGSKKTTFLQNLQSRYAIDLEALAMHRGSSFGKLLTKTQPAEASFENHLAMLLWQADFPRKKILMENESRLIGKIVIPKVFYEKTRELPRVFLKCDLEDRISNIHQEYIKSPLESFSKEDVKTHLENALMGIKSRLGGLLFQEIRTHLQVAFSKNNDEQHRAWIKKLLIHYYDPQYEHAIKKYTKETAFAGTADECKNWLRQNMDL